MLVEHSRDADVYELVPAVTRMYDSVPPEFLEKHPALSEFLFCLLDLLHEEFYQVETACRLHKASFYSKYRLFNRACIPTSVLNVLVDNCRKQKAFHPDRCHSEYLASRWGVPLVLVKRGTIFRIIRKLLSAVQSELACGNSSGVTLGWKKFVTLK